MTRRFAIALVAIVALACMATPGDDGTPNCKDPSGRTVECPKEQNPQDRRWN